MTQVKVKNTNVILVKDDITKQDTDAIVNAANSSLMGGGGVDGAIHRTGGNKILEECIGIVRKIGKLDTGKAVITTGGNLQAKYVIHTVGPIYRGGNNGEPKLLADAYYNSLLLGMQKKLRSIAFPSISTGIYGYPIELACRIAYKTVSNFIRDNDSLYEKVVFVVFSGKDYKEYEKVFIQKETNYL